MTNPVERLRSQNARPNKGKTSKKNDTKIRAKSNNSETTIYEEAVIMELDKDPEIEFNFKDNNQQMKRFSSSSDEQENTSGELKVSPNTKIQTEQDEQVLFQKFLDCRLEEFRKGVQGKAKGNKEGEHWKQVSRRDEKVLWKRLIN